MSNKPLKTLEHRIERDFLDHVRKPGRYIGGEVNQIKKDLAACDYRVALCFPDAYEVGMSNSGLPIIYHMLNSLDGVAAERVFPPWIDAEKVMRENRLPLYTLESKVAVRDFDLLGFSLASELCFTNTLTVLDLAGLALRSEDRTESDPLVFAGGGMANSCEPIAPFIDLFVLGDGEDAVLELIELLREGKRNGTSRNDLLLEAVRKFEWAYCPKFVEFEYDGLHIRSVESTEEGVDVRRSNAAVADFENAPIPAPIIPNIEAVHERVAVEIMRGCPWRCRFCQVSFLKRPIRIRSVDKIVELAKASYEATGFDTVTLLSLSSAEYPHLEELVTRLKEHFEPKYVGLSVPSLRVDRQLRLLPKLITSVRKGGLTMAVEASSERLRKIIQKPLSDEDLFAAVEAAYEAGWQRVKLYFIAGIPGETEEEIRQMVDLAHELSQLGKRVRGKPAEINAAVSWLVPKAHTPFSWFGQERREYFENIRRIVFDQKDKYPGRALTFKFHNIGESIVESDVGRGDRRMADVIESAWRAGARFDSWDETFDLDIWKQAFAQHGLDLEEMAARTFDPEEILPWEHLGGPDKEYLLKSYHRAHDTIAAV